MGHAGLLHRLRLAERLDGLRKRLGHILGHDADDAQAVGGDAPRLSVEPRAMMMAALPGWATKVSGPFSTTVQP